MVKKNLNIRNPAGRPETGIDDFTDKWGACKICEGEIPYGHQEACHIYTQEKEITRLRELGMEHAVEKNNLKTKAGNLQLVAGRYQFMWEAAQLCLNKIDDHLEYDFPPHKTFESIQKVVQRHLEIYTQYVSKPKAQIGK